MNEDKKELVKKTLEDMISSGEYSVLSDKLKLFRSIFE